MSAACQPEGKYVSQSLSGGKKKRPAFMAVHPPTPFPAKPLRVEVRLEVLEVLKMDL